MKKLVVNCAVCDMTRVQEETLAAYESITLNCASVIVTPETKALISRYPVQMNAASITEVPTGVKIRQLNGKCVITAGSGIESDAVLMVNGKVIIEDDALEAAQSYHSIQVNGKVIVPRSILDKLHNLNVNGKIVAYPDGAILLKGTEIIERTFALRAKPSLYYAEKRIVFVDKDIDVQRIAEKGVTFETPLVIVAESFCEDIIPLIDERAEIRVVPDGTGFVKEDASLDNTLIRRYGKKLYIEGNLTIREEEALRQAEYLHVTGKVRVTEGLKEMFFDLNAEYGEIEIIREYGCELCDKAMAKVDRKLLEKNPGGVLVCDCAIVKIAADIEEDMILERLVLQDVAKVNCTPEQESAVSVVSSGVAHINTGGDELPQEIFNTDPDTNVINAAKYVM